MLNLHKPLQGLARGTTRPSTSYQDSPPDQLIASTWQQQQQQQQVQGTDVFAPAGGVLGTRGLKGGPEGARGGGTAWNTAERSGDEGKAWGTLKRLTMVGADLMAAGGGDGSGREGAGGVGAGQAWRQRRQGMSLPPVYATASRYASRPESSDSASGKRAAASAAAAGGGGADGGGGSGSRKAMDEELGQLKAQMAVMQQALEGRLAGGGAHAAPAAAINSFQPAASVNMSGAGLAWPQLPFYPQGYHPFASAQQQQHIAMPWGMGAMGGFPTSAAGGEGSLGGTGAALGVATHSSNSSNQGYMRRGLPQELASDGEMVELHQRHLRQMAVLQMELDHAKGEKELQQVRQQLAGLMGSGGGAGEMGL